MGAPGTEDERRITSEHIARWREDGYVVVEDLLTPDELAAVQADAAVYLPTWEEYERAPSRYPHLKERPYFPEFPFAGLALNLVALHPELRMFAEEALGTEEVMVTQSHLLGKYAGTLDFDQALHRDYHNNTLVVPRSDGVYRQIPLMLYLTDVDEDLSPTYVVPNGQAEAVPPHQAFFSREDHPDLYTHERPVMAKAGSLLIYDVATIHRGSALRAAAGARWTYHFVYRSNGLEWMGWTAWPKVASGPDLHRVLEAATPEQRSMLGFPRVGDPYWTDETIAGVGRRYPGMDMAPYGAALGATSA